MTITYQITFYSYWAIGTGKGGGYGKDAIVLKDKNRLPFIPGKTLKGLLRDAAHESGMTATDIIILFGHENKKNNESSTSQSANVKGCLHVNSAYLEKATKQYLLQKPHMVPSLYESKTATKIGADKQAEDYSLRKIEVCIPLTMEATIENAPDNESLKKPMNMLRLMGEKRFRGLGRCKLNIISKI